MATVSCTCGEVQLQFPSTVPRSCNECCCRDCQKRLKVLELQGGPKLSFEKPISISLLDNNMVVTKGKDKLKFYKIRSETNGINMASTCCSSFLAGRNGDYHGNAVAIFPHFCKVTNLETHDIELLSYRSHWPLPIDPPSIPEVWMEKDGSFAGSGGWDTVLETVLGKVNAPIPEGGEGESMDELIESTGATVIVIDEEV